MVSFQVVAVYPSGRRFAVRDPHDTYLRASAHVSYCQRDAVPADTWSYEIDMTYTGSDGLQHWRGNVQPEELGYTRAEVWHAVPATLAAA